MIKSTSLSLLSKEDFADILIIADKEFDNALEYLFTYNGSSF